MQYDSFIEVFDTVSLTPEQPAHPMGKLFTYHPFPQPEALHYHDFLELGYCEYGSGVFFVDGEVVPFNGRCASIIYEGQRHIAQSISLGTSLWHFLYIDIGMLFADSEPYVLQQMNKNLRYRDYRFDNILAYEENPEIYELVRLILQETTQNAADTLQSLRGLVFSLMVKHGRLMERRAQSAGDSYIHYLEDIGSTLDYINMNYMEDITIDTLLGISNTSKGTLQRKFIAVTGYSPIQYLHNLRIKHATVMLLNKKKPITQISMDVGYNTLSSFNRMFLRLTGTSPSAWRKNLTAGESYEASSGSSLMSVELPISSNSVHKSR